VKRRGFGFDPLRPPHGSTQKLRRLRSAGNKRDLDRARSPQEKPSPPPVKAEFGDRFLKPAIEDGDWDPLADYLDRGFPLTAAIRNFLVEVLRGEQKRPKSHRPKKMVTPTAYLEVAAFVLDLKQKGARDPIKQATEAGFGMDRRTIQRAVAAWPNLTAETAAEIMVATGRRATMPVITEGPGWKLRKGDPSEG
jgi:hypothetical protein